MATIPPTITTPPAPPQRGVKATFSGLLDAFVTWLVAAVTQFSAVAANVYSNAVEAFNSATAATNAAAAAMATANVVLWVSGTTYQQYAAVISPANGRTYRRTTAAGSGTTDPSLDSTNYVQISGTLAATVLVASATVSTAVANIDFLNVFTSDCDRYEIEIEGVKSSLSSGDGLCIRLAVGGAVDSGTNYLSMMSPGGSASSADSRLALGISGSTTKAGSGTIHVRNSNSTLLKSVGVQGFDPVNSFPAAAEGAHVGTSAVTGFRLYMNNGSNFTAGTVRVYGTKNAT